MITGSSGLLGLNLALAAMDEYTVIGVDRLSLGGVPFELLRADLLDPEAADRVLDAARPDWLIHCAALANVDACEREPDLAQRLNVELPRQLAAASARRGVRMVHISTDAVFDGAKDGIYIESDTPNPLGVYARTKLDGESAVLAVNPDVTVARVNFFGWSLSGQRSLAEFFVNNLGAGKLVNGFDDVYFCPMFVGDLAEMLLEMLAKGLSGLYHVVGSESLTKFEFGRAIAQTFGFDAGLITPISVDESGLTAKRSHNLRLSVHKLSTDLGRVVPAFSTGLAKFYTQYQQGYPQKLRSYQQS